MDTSSDSLLGKQIDEYLIGGTLSTGGLTRIYRALDVKLQRYIALKVIAPEFRADPEHTVRFEREAQSIARLDHPNIVHIYRFGEANGLYYMAMQYIEGPDLAWLIQDYRASGNIMPIADIVRVAQDISGALDFAHGQGIIHRDVKPNNIMVDSTGRAVLTNFGLALLSDLGTHGEVFGSPHYVAPEQAVSSANAVPQSDLYALGVTLFEMLTGELPFPGDDAIDIALRHVSASPPRPSQTNPVIPAAVDEVILRSLEKEPYNRYQSGAELQAAFEQAMNDWQTGVTPGDPGTRPLSLVMLPAIPETQPPVFENERAIAPSSIVHAANTRTSWRNPLLLAGALYTLGLIGVVVFFAATYRPGPLSGAIEPTIVESASPVLAVLSTLSPTLTSTLAQSPMPPSLSVSAAPPATPTAVNPTLALPADRSVVPAGSRRLGEFAVESYCNSRGYGVRIVNKQRDWVCTNRATGAVVFTLGPADFDAICQSRYNDPAAFAIRDQQKSVQAYNWSCYEYVVPSPTAIATLSINTLFPHFTTEWVALVNVSNVPLSLDALVFKRDDGSTLKGTDWGRTVLMPGECLRLSRHDVSAPQLPSKCTTVIDYPPGKMDREPWFTDKVTIMLNPSMTYCYPAEKCSS